MKFENVLYDNSLLEGSRNIIQKNYKLFKKHEKELDTDIDEILNDIVHIRDFDRLIVGKVHGYGKDIIKFYYDASSYHYMKDVKIPTLFIHSLDDPVCFKD